MRVKVDKNLNHGTFAWVEREEAGGGDLHLRSPLELHLRLFSQSHRDYRTKCESIVGCERVGSQPNQQTERAEQTWTGFIWTFFV